MIKRRPFLGGAAAGVALFGGRGIARAAGGEKITVILDWLLNPNHAALFTALHSGAFGRAGLDVALVSPSDPDSPARLVAAGQADLAVGYGSQINMIVSAGLPLLRIASVIDTPLNTVAALGDGSIHTLADLKGRTIGVSVSGVEDAILDAMLLSAGIARSDVTVIKVNFNMVAALISHRLDAAIGAYRNVEVLQLRQMGLKPTVFLPEEHGVPRYDELILVAGRDRRDDPRLKRFVAALQEGTDILLKNPDGVWVEFAAAHPELDTGLIQASWKATMPAIAKDPAALDGQRYLNFQNFALAHGIIETSMPLDQFAVEVR